MSKIIAVDLDDTLCFRPKDVEHLGIKKYEYCTPIVENIKLVNVLYEKGYTIIVYTARGMSHFNGDINAIYNNLFLLTKTHLDLWNLKYHQLVMGKLHYDMLIDDKAFLPETLSRIVESC